MSGKIGCSWLLLLLVLTSCMGESGDKMDFYRNGVLVTQPVQALYTTDGSEGYIITSPEIEGLNDAKVGDCFEVEFRGNLTSQPADNLFRVKVKQLTSVPLWSLAKTNEEAPDTTRMENEQTITLSLNRTQYIEGRLFMPVELNNYLSEQVDHFILTYNPDKEPTLKEKTAATEDEPAEVQRVYELYLRATKEGGPDTLAIKKIQSNAFLLESFVKEVGEIERAAGNNELYFRFNYAQRFTTDSTRVQWAQSGLFTIEL